MRRTRAYRREQTRRIIRNREARYRREAPSWYWIALEDGWLRTGHRLQHTNAYWDCGNTRCGLCHADKNDPRRRARENRAWRKDWDADIP